MIWGERFCDVRGSKASIDGFREVLSDVVCEKTTCRLVHIWSTVRHEGNRIRENKFCFFSARNGVEFGKLMKSFGHKISHPNDFNTRHRIRFEV